MEGGVISRVFIERCEVGFPFPTEPPHIHTTVREKRQCTRLSRVSPQIKCEGVVCVVIPPPHQPLSHKQNTGRPLRDTMKNGNDSVDKSPTIYHPSEEARRSSHVPSMERYRQMHAESLADPEKFWNEIAYKQFHWETPYTKFVQYNLDRTKGPVSIKWLEGATTNISYNLLDRNVKLGHGDKIAFYWEGNDPDDYSRLTYRKLLEEVCRFANVLKSKGVAKGDRVGIYVPMILEAVIAMLACARIGAVHSIVFAGFSSDSLGDRIFDCKCKVMLTVDFAYRGEKLLKLKSICSQAMKRSADLGHTVQTCVVVRHLPRLSASMNNSIKEDMNLPWDDDTDVWWHDEMEDADTACYPVWVNAEDPLFMLYTSGSTGKPKGVLHTTGGYLMYSATTFKYVFDYKPNDVYWCTADVGWITGHTYVVYGPLANAATSVIFEGVPFYPDNDRFWSVIEKYKVNQFYTAPTALRALMKFGEGPLKKHDLQSLKVLGSVGEPINKDAWLWYFNHVGSKKCSIVDTFFQTETGGHVITPLPGCTPMKPSSATFPFFGVEPKLLDEEGHEIEGPGEGYLVFKRPWPGMMRTLFGNHARFEEVYFSRFPGYYATGDGARRDEDGYLWVTGRIDDMLNVSGHLMSTAEVESVLAEHPGVAEAAVVSRPHTVKGECLYCFITPQNGQTFDTKLTNQLKNQVREKIGPFAMPDVIHYAPSLPKTRSGKIMRRILRKIAVNDTNIGDTSTLADESTVATLFKTRPENLKNGS